VLLGIVVSCLVILNWTVDAIKQRIVTPPALASVQEDVNSVKANLATQVISTTRLSGKVGDMDARLARVEDLFEIVAIDVCLRRRGDPWAIRKMNCSQYLNGD